jgi:uncharacterized protein (TIGR02246 family)
MVMQVSAFRRATDREEDAVRTLYRGYVEAWNRGDAEGMAALFSEDGSAIGVDGSRMDGAYAIARTLRATFADHTPPPYAWKIESIRFLSPDVAVLRAIAELDERVPAIHTLVAERLIGDWHIALFQATPAH